MINKQENSKQPQPKQEEQAVDIYTCDKCLKKFTSQPLYQTHLKQKHEQQSDNRPKPLKKSLKNRKQEQQQNDLEDNIYAYLGQLGEMNPQQPTNRAEFVIPDQNYKVTGQTNYSLNKVVRTPYELDIQPRKQIPGDRIQSSPYKQFMSQLQKQISVLDEKIEEEKQIWQFRDPMAPEQQTENQFSLMDIRKLIQNYPRRKIELKYPNFSIFMLWISRICKASAWKEFFISIATYLALYEKYKKENDGQQWQEFWTKFQAHPSEQVWESNTICNQRNGIKFVEFFVKWTQIFDLIPN